jgi:adenosine deaminase
VPHAGEWAGPDNVRATIEHLRPDRIGHGVRAIEDPALVAELAERGTVLEVCPTSNVVLGVFTDLATHPLRVLHDAGVRVTLNSDDPPYWGASVGGEYELAERAFGFTPAQLEGVTRTAIEASFAENALKTALLGRLGRGAL